jgi:amino acid adenylation domain-containing protein
MSNALYALLQQTAAARPDSLALLFRDRQMSYRQLLDESTRAAALLAMHGARPGRRVAFCFRKSPEALIALFALIRTGATYVPLDPVWPADRAATICRDAGIELWVGNVAPPIPLATVFAPPLTGPGVALSSAVHGDGHEPAEPSGGIANILFTSGSTGRPKGIEITARSLLHFSRWVVETFALGPADRLANHAPYSFDLSTLDIFAAVRAGAAMCPVPEEIKGLPYQVARLIAELKITVWYSVPFALTVMLDKLAAHDLGALRHIFFAGEVMPKSTLRALARALPHASLTNLYGPTETNVCTWHAVTPEDLLDDAPLPIGRAISDTRLWIVGEAGQPGELLVAGPTVTAGYAGDPDLTARRLVPAPDGDGLAYRTGDLVSRRADGVLLFHGRCDRLIKCRGYRIEPGEVEAVLAAHPAVKEAFVFLETDPRPAESVGRPAGSAGRGPAGRPADSGAGDRLIACIAPASPGERPTEAELTAHCRRYLPPAMLPDEWRTLEALPRTDRGKVDLEALRRL